MKKLNLDNRSGQLATYAASLATGVLLFLGCSKEPLSSPGAMDNPSSASKINIGERFVPAEADIMPLIRGFQAKKHDIELGQRDEMGEKALQEALWLMEASANFEKGDPSLVGVDWLKESTTKPIPVNMKLDGSLWVSDADMIAKYNELQIELEMRFGAEKIYLVDFEIESVSETEAILKAEWLKKDPTVEVLEAVTFPSYSGCFEASDLPHGLDGGDIMRSKIFMHRMVEVPHAGVITGVYMPWFYSTVVDELGNRVGYPYYVGTPYENGLGGPALLYSGLAGPDAFCFPLRWQRYLELRTMMLDALNLQPNEYTIYDEYVVYNSPRTGNAWSYGSPYYPMGPWDHGWRFKIAHFTPTLMPG